MKRITLMLFILLVLTACSERPLESGFNEGLSKPIAQSTNQKKQLMRYYLPPLAGVKDSDTNTTVFTVENYDVLMRMSIDKIVSENFEYETKHTVETFEDALYEDEVSYIDIQNDTKKMNLRVYQLKDQYALFLSNLEVDMIALVPKTHVAITLETMVDVLKTVVIDKEKVVSAYSNKEISTYDSTYSEFFEQTPPETGTLKEMYEQLNPKRD